MSSEKSLPIYSEKTLLRDESSRKKVCSKYIVSWVLAGILVALIVVVSIQFLYPVMEEKYRLSSDSFHLFNEKPVEVRVMSPLTPSFGTSQEGPEKSEESVSSEASKSHSKSHSKSKKKQKPWHLEFLINPSHLCATRMPPQSEKYQNDPELKLLMVVPSSPDHFEQRAAIRNTWGSIAEKPRGPMRLGFIIGTTTDEAVNGRLIEESEEYNDIIQADFEENTEQSSTIKSIIMLKWVAKYCAHAQYFLKADDDTFVNVGIIARVLDREPYLSADKFIGGYLQKQVEPTRNPNEKYYVSEDEYPDELFPPYVSGSAYISTGPTAVDLFEATQKVEPLLPMEDVFITGLCAQEVEITLVHEPRFRFDDPPKPASWDTYSNFATAHSVTPDELMLLWNEMSKSILDHLYKQEEAINATSALRRR